MTRRVPDLLVEQLALGELPEARAAEVRAALRAEPGGLERLAALAAADRAFAQEAPAERVLQGARARAVELAVAETRRRRRTWGMIVPALAVAVAVVAVVGADLGPGVDDPDAPGIRTKGLVPGVVVYRAVGDGVEVLHDGDPVAAGDRIQLGRVGAGAAHGVLLGVDGRGTVSVHAPLDGDTRLEEAGEVLLDFSLELDDAPEHETFVWVTGDRPLDPGDLVRQLRAKGAGGPFVGPDGAPLDVRVVRLEKEAAR